MLDRACACHLYNQLTKKSEPVRLTSGLHIFHQAEKEFINFVGELLGSWGCGLRPLTVEEEERIDTKAIECE